MRKKTAILFGATGLTGTHVLKNLINDERYEKIKVFTRSELPVQSGLTAQSDKLEVFKTGLDELDNYENSIRGDDVFCCLGTTIKKAGSKENFRKVDFDYPVKIAELANKNEVPAFLIISSIGAYLQSSNFYLRTKGEVEKAIQEFSFKKIIILRPSMLMGKRREFRLMEEIGKVIMLPLSFFLTGKLRKYRAIDAEKVAAAMVQLANAPAPKNILESHEIESYVHKQI